MGAEVRDVRVIRLSNRLFGTEPLAAHCPGPLHDEWRMFEAAVLTSGRRECACPDLTILTWDSRRETKGPSPLEKSLQLLGVQPVVLGAGRDPWRNRDKISLTAEALPHVTTPFVMAIDAHDALVVGDPSQFVERFCRNFACQLVFNATGSWCWPPLPEFLDFESSLPAAAGAHGRHWFNSGAWIGRTAFCRDYFRVLSEEPSVPGFNASDQAIFKRTWPNWYPEVQLDYQSVLFQWFNEDRKHFHIERSLDSRQVQLLNVLKSRPQWMNRTRLRGAEVGVWEGLTSAALLNHLQHLELWMIDPWLPFKGACGLDALDAAAFWRAKERARWWTQSHEDRRYMVEEASEDAALWFGNHSLDFVFLDGNHLYESIRQDIAWWWPKVAPGGLLMGHDYGVYGDADGRWGVRRAVDEFAAREGRKVSVGMDGVWWIEKAP